jgi:hypothetical protein
MLTAIIGGTTGNILHPAIEVPGGDIDVHFASDPPGIVTLNPDFVHIPACIGNDCVRLQPAFLVSVTAAVVAQDTWVNLTNVEDGSVWAVLDVQPPPPPPMPRPSGPHFVANGPAVLDFGLVDEGQTPHLSFQFTAALV